MRTLAYNNNHARALEDQEIYRLAPSIFAEHAASDRSERYRYLPTIEIINGLRTQGFQVVAAAQSSTRKEEHDGFQKHQIRLRSHDGFSAVGELKPEIVITNSHNGTSAYQINAGLFRLACLNGLIVSDSTIETVKVRHTGRSTMDDVIEGVFRVMDTTETVQERIETFRSIELPTPVQTAFASAALALRWEPEDETGRPTAPVQPESILRIRRWDDKKDDLFTVFNRVQENLIKGGIIGRNSNGGRYTTRSVNSVSEDTRLNKALWTLADQLAGIVSGQDMSVAA